MNPDRGRGLNPKCPLCGKRKANLDAHMKAVHGIDNKDFRESQARKMYPK